MFRTMIAAALGALTAGIVVAPVAAADMRYGNYDVLSNRWTDATWVWAAYPARRWASSTTCQPAA